MFHLVLVVTLFVGFIPVDVGWVMFGVVEFRFDLNFSLWWFYCLLSMCLLCGLNVKVVCVDWLVLFCFEMFWV